MVCLLLAAVTNPREELRSRSTSYASMTRVKVTRECSMEALIANGLRAALPRIRNKRNVTRHPFGISPKGLRTVLGPIPTVTPLLNQDVRVMETAPGAEVAPCAGAADERAHRQVRTTDR